MAGSRIPKSGSKGSTVIKTGCTFTPDIRYGKVPQKREEDFAPGQKIKKDDLSRRQHYGCRPLL